MSGKRHCRWEALVLCAWSSWLKALAGEGAHYFFFLCVGIRHFQFAHSISVYKRTSRQRFSARLKKGTLQTFGSLP